MEEVDFISKTEAFDIHRRIYSAMVWLGVYKLHSSNPHYERLHFAYRLFVIAMAFLLNVQHLIYMYGAFLNSDGSGLQYEMFIEEISHINFFGKLTALSLNSSKLDAVHTLIKDPIFAPENEKDEQYIKEHKAKALRLFKMVNSWMTFSMTLWITNRVLKKIEQPDFTIPSYFPFDTSHWIGFLCSCLYEAFSAIWSGFGHYGLDCMIASYYMQATSQLKSIKYKLRHAFDQDSEVPAIRPFKFKDELDAKFNERFIYYVRRYGKISWFIEQLNSTLNFGISVNFMTLSLAMCLIVYALGSLNLFSVEFMFMFTALFVFQAQNFMYCYYGHLVQHEPKRDACRACGSLAGPAGHIPCSPRCLSAPEWRFTDDGEKSDDGYDYSPDRSVTDSSDSVNTAVYFSDWLSVSPKFRRQILIAMSRWHYRVIPKVSSVVPVSLATFVAVTRLAYTIYTVMKSYESKSI